MIFPSIPFSVFFVLYILKRYPMLIVFVFFFRITLSLNKLTLLFATAVFGCHFWTMCSIFSQWWHNSLISLVEMVSTQWRAGSGRCGAKLRSVAHACTQSESRKSVRMAIQILLEKVVRITSCTNRETDE